MRYTRTLVTLDRSAFAALCITALSLAPSIFAQQPPCTQRTIPVSVITETGKPATGLTAANFTGKFHGQPLHITSITPAQSLPTVLILLDVSGSMRDFPNGTTGELDLAHLVADRLPAGVPTGLALARQTVALAITPTADRAQFRRGIELIRADANATGPRGMTALWDALLSTLTLTPKLQPGDVIYLVSDGVDDSSKATLPQVEGGLLAAGVRVFAALRPSSVPQELRAAGRFSNFVVEATGGDAFEVSSYPKNWPGPVAAQVQQIVNYYDLAFDFPTPMDKPADLQLKLAGFDKDAVKHLILRYPQQLFPCASPRR